MLVDNVKITIQSGNGGEGLISFDNRGKAYGGDGGVGGSVIIRGNTNTYDLSRIDPKQKYMAEDGGKGQTYRKDGKNGEPLIINVPLVARILDSNGEEIAVIKEHGQEFEILKGGEGGLGNYSMRAEGWDGKLSRKRASKGETKQITIELNLKSDIILLGYPNAGKSSLINALTRANSRVAAYEFTTLDPQLGVMDGYIRIMDLPGLIEGTHEGKGVGTKFLKHTKYSEILLHCISIENDDLVERYESMRKEFGNISPTLADMSELVVLTKSDILTPQEAEGKQKVFEEKTGINTVLISAYLPDTLDSLKERIKQMLGSRQN